MTMPMLIVFAVLAATIALFISDRLRLDITAMLGMLALMVSGVLTPGEALAGFGDPTVLLIAALIVVGDGLFQTGVAAWIGRRLERLAGTGERRILVVLMVPVAVLSAFISSTGTVAIMLPVAVSLAQRAGISPSKLLIPLAYAALIGGMLTLIGTPPNLIAAEALAGAGRPALGFFSFTPIGLLVLAVCTALMALLGARLIPPRAAVARGDARGPSLAELAAEYRLTEGLARVRVTAGSPLAGATLAESRLRARYGITVVGVRRWPSGRPAAGRPRAADAATRILAGDLIDLIGDGAAVAALCAGERLDPHPGAEGLPFGPDLHLVELALTPRSRFIGQTAEGAELRSLYGVTVLGAQRLGQPLAGDPAREPLRFGDTLLVAGAPAALEQIVREQRTFGDITIAALPHDLQAGGAQLGPRAPLAALIMLAMLGAMAAGWLPTVTAALLAAMAMLLSGCVAVRDLYRRMSWESLVLIAAMLPMATALEKTGGAALIAGGLADTLGGLGPLAVLAGVFLLTSLLSQFISNTATAVLIMPIALGAAAQLGLAPEPLLVTAAIAASTAFATPIASPVNTLVLGPGAYRFADYARAGVPLQLAVLLICLLTVPIFFPW